MRMIPSGDLACFFHTVGSDTCTKYECTCYSRYCVYSADVVSQCRHLYQLINYKKQENWSRLDFLFQDWVRSTLSSV